MKIWEKQGITECKYLLDTRCLILAADDHCTELCTYMWAPMNQRRPARAWRHVITQLQRGCQTLDFTDSISHWSYRSQ